MASLRVLSVAALLALVLVVASAGAQAASLQQDASVATSGGWQPPLFCVLAELAEM